MRGLAAAISSAIAALALAGCGHVEMHEVMLRTPSGPSTHAAEMYFAGHDPVRPYYEVGLVQAIAVGNDADLEDVARSLASRATLLGCDAIVRVRVDQGWSRAHGFGVCVRWSPAASASPAPTGPQETPIPPPSGQPL